jgi:pimeloyl-ACP methyl ester carboxylesterase
VSEAGFVIAAGHRLETVWHGPGPARATTLVFLHEGLGCVAMWRDFPEALTERTGCGALVYSRHGYGRSDMLATARPLDYMTGEGRATLGEVLDAFAVERAILIGHSDGASIALVHAGTPRARPRVRGLVLEAPHVFCEDVSVEAITRARQEFEHGELREKLAKYHGDNVDGAFWGWNRAWLDPGFRDFDITELLPSIEVPVLLLQGDEDPYGTVAQLDVIERAVRGPVERRLLAGVGHAPHKDAPERVLEEMATFVSGVVADL